MGETLAVIPARGGSKGVPGKNMRPLAGLPLIVHSIELGRLCPEIARTIVSTDSKAIATVTRDAGGDVPFLRPAELARDDTPMLPVLRHALDELDPHGTRYELLLLLDPTSPGRLPEDVERAHGILREDSVADGVVAVSEPSFNPMWTAVFDRGGYLEPAFRDAGSFSRRQDVPRVLRVNAALYLFRTPFLRSETESWSKGRHRVLEIPELRAFHLDSEDDFALCELVLERGLVRLPWL
jgi:CMP-N,N'-diacetyllegionaminic acid synthase